VGGKGRWGMISNRKSKDGVFATASQVEAFLFFLLSPKSISSDRKKLKQFKDRSGSKSLCLFYIKNKKPSGK